MEEASEFTMVGIIRIIMVQRNITKKGKNIMEAVGSDMVVDSEDLGGEEEDTERDKL